jgi:hypothetical protein
MSCGGRHERAKGRMGARWTARLLGAGVAGMLLLPVGAWAAGPSASSSAGNPTVGDASMTAVAPNGGVRLTLVGTTSIGDQELATEVAKGLAKPQSTAGQGIQGPQVMLWDDIERPGALISSGSVDTATVYTSSVWH